MSANVSHVIWDMLQDTGYLV